MKPLMYLLLVSRPLLIPLLCISNQILTGGNYGTGRRSGGVSTFICAVVDDRGNVNQDDELKYVYQYFHISSRQLISHAAPRYSTFVRIGTGLTYADYVWVRQKNWKVFDKNNMPSWYQASKRSLEDKGDVYLEPEE